MKRLGRYELLELLGEGGMGQVWLARITGTGGFEKLCIVKTVLPALAKDPQFVSRFLHEGRLLTQLQHANIAQVFDMGDEGGTLLLALEYVAGVDLSRLMQELRTRGEKLPVPVAIYLVEQMAEGLAFAHRRAAADGTPLHIVHRDVSPQNAMISWDGEVKVIDFGIARSEARSHATAQASVMGKLGYMAPEQARGEAVDHRADQYACAVVLWELLADDAYVPRGTLSEMVVAMANPRPRALVPLRPDVPPSLEEVLSKALAPTPAARFPTTDDFAQALMTELVRLSGLPSKLQVGEYVQAHCDGLFSQQRERINRLATLHAPPPQPTVATPLPLTAPLSTPVPLTAPVAAPLPATAPQAPGTAELQRTAVQRSLWVPALALVALVLGGVVLALLLRAPKTVAQTLITPSADTAPRPPLSLPKTLPGVPEDAGALAQAPLPEEVDAGLLAPAPPLPTTLPDAPPPPVLRVRGSASYHGVGIALENSSSFTWRGCTATLPGGLSQAIPSLSPTFRRDLPRAGFSPHPNAPRITDGVLVSCPGAEPAHLEL
jgi:serine/threonine-protein kinase